ncbi:MAG: plastocyanin/azurin family copper-binding protein [Actinomycetota bacterium]
MRYGRLATLFSGNILSSSLFATSALLVFVAVFSVSACGGSGGAIVTLRELRFEPDAVTVKKGESVTWKNEDRRNRQIMSGAPLVMTDEFMSPVIETGQSWSHTFDQSGEFPYHDMKIPNQLGRVIVEE